MCAEDWNTQVEYLLDARQRNSWFNEDYLNFLFFDVWKLNRKPCRILEVGCGTGNVPLWLLPHFPAGTQYTGIDNAEKLLEEAKTTFNGSPFNVNFLKGNARQLDFPGNSFDIVLTRAVLMHLEEPLQAVQEMVRVTRPGGAVVSCEASRNGWYALFNIAEADEIANIPLGMIQRTNQTIKERSGIDYNIGMKLPVIFHQNGLKEIECRFNDRISCILPPDLTPEMINMYEWMCRYGGAGVLDKQRAVEWKQRLQRDGATEEEAAKEIGRYQRVDFAGKGKTYHTVYPHIFVFCRGIKPLGRISTS
jgi:SAM-dependent methyltransferase